MQRLLANRNGIQPLEQLSTDELRRSLLRWDKQVRRLSHLIDNLLPDLAHLGGAARSEAQRRWSISSKVAREIVGRLWSEGPSAETAATVTAEAGPVVGLWDPLRVEQVVSNLLANALKYGGGKPVAVTVKVATSVCMLRGPRSGHRHRGRKAGQDLRTLRAGGLLSRVYGGLGPWAYEDDTSPARSSMPFGGMLEVSSNPGRGSVFTMRTQPIGTGSVVLPAPGAQPSSCRSAGADRAENSDGALMSMSAREDGPKSMMPGSEQLLRQPIAIRVTPLGKFAWSSAPASAGEGSCALDEANFPSGVTLIAIGCLSSTPLRHRLRLPGRHRLVTVRRALRPTCNCSDCEAPRTVTER